MRFTTQLTSDLDKTASQMLRQYALVPGETKLTLGERQLILQTVSLSAVAGELPLIGGVTWNLELDFYDRSSPEQTAGAQW